MLDRLFPILAGLCDSFLLDSLRPNPLSFLLLLLPRPAAAAAAAAFSLFLRFFRRFRALLLSDSPAVTGAAPLTLPPPPPPPARRDFFKLRLADLSRRLFLLLRSGGGVREALRLPAAAVAEAPNDPPDFLLGSGIAQLPPVSLGGAFLGRGLSTTFLTGASSSLLPSEDEPDPDESESEDEELDVDEDDDVAVAAAEEEAAAAAAADVGFDDKEDLAATAEEDECPPPEVLAFLDGGWAEVAAAAAIFGSSGSTSLISCSCFCSSCRFSSNMSSSSYAKFLSSQFSQLASTCGEPLAAPSLARR